MVQKCKRCDFSHLYVDRGWYGGVRWEHGNHVWKVNTQLQRLIIDSFQFATIWKSWYTSALLWHLKMQTKYIVVPSVVTSPERQDILCDSCSERRYEEEKRKKSREAQQSMWCGTEMSPSFLSFRLRVNQWPSLMQLRSKLASINVPYHTSIMPNEVKMFPNDRNHVTNLRVVTGVHEPEINEEEKEKRTAAHVMGNYFIQI